MPREVAISPGKITSSNAGAALLASTPPSATATQVKAKLGEGDARKSLSAKLALRSYGLEERYRKTFWEGVWRGSVEFWNEMDNKPLLSTRPPSANERDQLRRTAAVCNISVLADYLYRLQTEYCVDE
jgi:hypothetical protein